MDNPGLKRHGAEPFLKVSDRRYADVMAAPTIDATEQGYLYNDQMDPLMPGNVDNTSREDVTQGPPMAGGVTQLPVPATNGELTQDRSVNLRQHMAGNPVTQVPGQVRQKLTQDPAILDQHAQQDMQAQLAQATKDRQIAVQQQDGRNENPAYNRAQQQIQDKLNLRRAHPLHQGAIYPTHGDSEYGLQFFKDDEIRPRDEEFGRTNYTDQPMFQVKRDLAEDPNTGEPLWDEPHYTTGGGVPGCETCWLKYGVPNSYEEHHGDMHPFKPMEQHTRVAAMDYDRGEWLYDLDDPNYFKKDPAPSVIEGGTHQPMIDLKPVEGDLGLDQPSRHPGYPACEGCEDLGYMWSRHPNDPVHVGERDPDLHPYQPVEDLPPGVRLAGFNEHGEWEYDLDDPNYFRNDPAPSSGEDDFPTSNTRQPMVWERDTHPEYKSHEFDEEGYIKPGVPLAVLAPYRETGYERDWRDDLRRQEPGIRLGAHPLHQGAYDPDDPLAPPSGGGGSRRPRTEDYGLGDDGWHRFGLMHPEGYDDKQNITIAVKHHGDVTSSPFGNKGDIRPQFEVRVGKGETQVMPSNGGGYPYWGSALSSGIHTSHRDVAQGVAAALGSDAQDIDLPLHQRSMYDDRDKSMTEQNYPWAMGEGQHEWPVLGDTGGSVPYSDPEKEFLREHADRLAKAGIEDYELNQTGEPSTLVNLDHHEDGGHAPETKPHPRYGAFAKLAGGDESDEDFWARQPDVVNDISDSADQTGQAFLEPGDVESDLDDMIPDNTLLREHAHVMRNGFRWNGDLRNPMYEREHWRDTVDSEGRPTHDQEGHVIERNTRVLSPQLDEDASPLSYPWMHTYHPAGVGDEEGLVSGHNTAQGATRAAIQLGLYGTHHPRSQELLKGYRYVGSGEPYDPSVELPHDAAQRMRG